MYQNTTTRRENAGTYLERGLTQYRDQAADVQRDIDALTNLGYSVPDSYYESLQKNATAQKNVINRLISYYDDLATAAKESGDITLYDKYTEQANSYRDAIVDLDKAMYDWQKNIDANALAGL